MTIAKRKPAAAKKPTTTRAKKKTGAPSKRAAVKKDWIAQLQDIVKKSPEKKNAKYKWPKDLWR